MKTNGYYTRSPPEMPAPQPACMICLSRLVAAAKSSYPMQGGQVDESRRATQVFHKEADGRWRCTVDSSYGSALREVQAPGISGPSLPAKSGNIRGKASVTARAQTQAPEWRVITTC